MDHGLPAALLATGVVAALGAVTLTTGWVAPWARGRVVRPALWGAGALVFAAGMATGLSTHFFDVSLGSGDALAVDTLAQIAFGGLLQHRAQRPGRTCAAPATKNAS
ncbi:hypothetical protein AB0E88_34705 [Streptomyces sp. NPDC028635]|uniref:hypothetical protein n=1 Tax=Streptomyces sp. NPDC028635 TaxID=3154800 RepID=UPI0033F6D2B5